MYQRRRKYYHVEETKSKFEYRPSRGRRSRSTHWRQTQHTIEQNVVSDRPSRQRRQEITSIQFVQQFEEFVDCRNVEQLPNLIRSYTYQYDGIVNLQINRRTFQLFSTAITLLSEQVTYVTSQSIISIIECHVFKQLCISTAILSSENSYLNYQLIKNIFKNIGPSRQLLYLCQQHEDIAYQIQDIDIFKSFNKIRYKIITALDGQFDYKTCPIHPCQNDFISNSQNQGQIFKVRTTEPYQSVSEYLNNNFYIIREEFLANLRTAIYTLRQAKFNRIPANIQSVYLYHRVEMMNYLTTDNGIEIHLQFQQYSLNDRAVPKINWKQTKRMNQGHLAILTTYEMYPLIFCTIQECRVNQKLYNKNQTIKASFTMLSPEDSLHNLNIIFNSCRRPYLIEYPQLYEPTFRYLTTIQNANITTYPFQKHLIEASKISYIPSYATIKQKYKIDLSGQQVYSEDYIKIYKPWPTLETTLDPSQLEAVKCMLTHQIAIIQGPPGTGKTYCGTLAVRILLENLPQFTPIVMVCYTNHALDQFLLKLLNYVKPEEMVRVGNQSKVEVLQQLSLKNLRKAQKKFNFNWTLYNQTKKQLDNLLDLIIKGDNIRNVTYEIVKQQWSSVSEQIVIGFKKANQLHSTNVFCVQSKHILVEAWMTKVQPNSRDLLNKIIAQEQQDNNQLIFNQKLPRYYHQEVTYIQDVELTASDQGYQFEYRDTQFVQFLHEYEEVYLDSDDDIRQPYCFYDEEEGRTFRSWSEQYQWQKTIRVSSYRYLKYFEYNFDRKSNVMLILLSQ